MTRTTQRTVASSLQVFSEKSGSLPSLPVDLVGSLEHLDSLGLSAWDSTDLVQLGVLIVFGLFGLFFYFVERNFQVARGCERCLL